MAQQVTKSTFDETVLKADGIVLVDFYADWCGPCKMVAPIIDELSEEMSDVTFVKVNVDEEGELAQEYNVVSIPTFVIFKDGSVASQFMGAQGKEAIKAEIEKVQNG